MSGVLLRPPILAAFSDSLLFSFLSKLSLSDSDLLKLDLLEDLGVFEEPVSNKLLFSSSLLSCLGVEKIFNESFPVPRNLPERSLFGVCEPIVPVLNYPLHTNLLYSPNSGPT